MLPDYRDVTKRILIGDESWIYAYNPETDDPKVSHVKASQKSMSR